MILDKCIVGWETVEPCFVANVAIERAFIMLGKHGTGKTTAGKLMGGLYSADAFRFYDAPKTDMIALAGIPSPDALKAGKFEFCHHDNTIWNAKVVLVDEISRANKATQNLWLEIIQERKLLGKDLSYKVLVATMNPQSYSSVLSLDAALSDRFSAVINIPDPGEDADLNSQTMEILNLNINPDRAQLEEATIQALKKAVKATRDSYDSYYADGQVRQAVFEYVSSLISVVHDKSGKDKERVYISRRKPVQLAEQILGIGSYYHTMGATRPLERGAQEAIMHTISGPLKIDPKIVNGAHEKLREHLSSASMTHEERLRLKMASLGSVEEKLGFLKREKKTVAKWPLADLEKELRDIFTSIRSSTPGKIHQLINTLECLDRPTSVLSEAQGFAILQLNKWVTDNIITQDKRNWNKDFVVSISKIRHDVVSGKDKRLVGRILSGKDVSVDHETGELK